MNQATRIKIKLLISGVSQAELAREIGVTKMMVGMVIHGKRTSHRIMTHIAKRLGCSVPELFGAAKERRRRVRRKAARRTNDRRAS